MRIVILFAILLTLPLPGHGQVETKEHFLAEVFEQTPYASWKKVYLEDTARGWMPLSFSDTFELLSPVVSKNIPDSSVRQIMANANQNESEKWGKIAHIKIVDLSAWRFNKTKRHSSIYKIETAFISNVVFDNRQHYAMVRMGRRYGKYCGGSDLYFFKKVNNKWEMIFTTCHAIR